MLKIKKVKYSYCYILTQTYLTFLITCISKQINQMQCHSLFFVLYQLQGFRTGSYG